MSVNDLVIDVVKEIKNKYKASSKWTRWFWYLLLGIGGVALTGILVYGALQKSKKTAKALHERDVLLEKKQQAEVDALVTSSAKKKKQHLKKAKEYLKEANSKAKKVKELEKQAKNNKERINNLRSWDDVDKNVKY